MGHSRHDGGSAPGGRDWRAVVREAGPYLGLGMQLAGAMFIFVFGGYLLDDRLGTTPWLTITGAVLGMVAVFTYIFRASAEIGNSQAKPKGGRRGAGKRGKTGSDGEAEKGGGEPENR